MFIYFRVKDRIIDEGYFGDTECENCGHKEQHYYTVFGRSFYFGKRILPIRVTTWDIRATVVCNNCNTSSDTSTNNTKLKTKLASKIEEYPLWKVNKRLVVIAAFLSLFIILPAIQIATDLLTPTESKIVGLWVIRTTDSTTTIGVKPNENNDDFGHFTFHEDKTFSIMAFDTIYCGGKWNYDDDTITLFANNEQHKLFLRDIDDLSLSLFLEKDNQDKPSRRNWLQKKFFFCEKSGVDTSIMRPYRPEFNTWRQKPTRPESDAEIKKRVTDFLSFLYLQCDNALLCHTAQIRLDKVTPFQIGGNGIILEVEHPEWARIFYSNVDAEKGMKLLHDAFPHSMDFEEQNIFLRLRNFFEDYRGNVESK